MLLPLTKQQLNDGYTKALKAISNCTTKKEIIATGKFTDLLSKQLQRHGYIGAKELDMIYIAQFNAINILEKHDGRTSKE